MVFKYTRDTVNSKSKDFIAGTDPCTSLTLRGRAELFIPQVTHRFLVCLLYQGGGQRLQVCLLCVGMDPRVVHGGNSGPVEELAMALVIPLHTIAKSFGEIETESRLFGDGTNDSGNEHIVVTDVEDAVAHL